MPAAMRSSTRGFTLVETLVALVILAGGMLGIAALYVEGLRAGRTSIYRSAAIMLSADMADRIRANAQGVDAYAGIGPGSDLRCANGAVDCTPPELASDDWFRWRGQLQARLPEGARGEISVTDTGGGSEVQIMLSWPEPGQAVDAPASYTTVFHL